MRGDGRCYQRGSRWWIAYYVKRAGVSREVREPGGTSEKEALKKLKQRRREIAAHDLGLQTFSGPASERLTVEDLLCALAEHYQIEKRELSRSLSHMTPLRRFFGLERVIRVSATSIQQFVLDRQQAGMSIGTIARELRIFRRAFSLAVSQRRLNASQVPDFPVLTEEHVREGFVERGDFEAILSHLNDPDVRDFVQWAFWTGMRRGEIAQLGWAALDREGGALTLPGRITKNGKPRKLILEGVYRAILARRSAARRLDCPLIFHREGQPMGSFRKSWANACKKAGVPGLLFHDLRRSAVRNMVRAGVDKTIAKRLSGHRTDAVFDRYNICSDEDLRQAALKHEAYVSSLPITQPKTIVESVR